MLVALAAFFSKPPNEDYQPDDLVNTPLFPQFTDPATAAALEIVNFDEELARLGNFEVRRDADTGLWTIPSHGGYPADAEEMMTDAATSLVDLTVLGIKSELESDHESHGVVEPDKDKLEATQEGVGALVTLSDNKGEEIAGLIIGKEVEGRDNLRFVRMRGKTPIFVVEIDPEKFPIEFEKWIEKDLLELQPLDLQKLTLQDYSVDEQQGTVEKRLEVGVTWNSEESAWELNNMVSFAGNKPTPTRLAPYEELNAENLNTLKNALGDLKIVGVQRKPKGLGADPDSWRRVYERPGQPAVLTAAGFLHGS